MTATTTKGDGARAEMTPLLTVEDLERLFRVDRATISRLCKKGQLPMPLKLGGSNRWTTEDIAAALELLRPASHRQSSSPNALTATVP